MGSVLINMRRHRLPVDDISHNALLARVFGRKNTESSRADLPTTVADDVDEHFLPAVLTPRLAATMPTQIGNVLHAALHIPCE